MTLNIKMGFYGFFDDFGLRHTFHERIAPKLLDRPGHSAYKTFSIKCSFHLFKFCPFMFKEFSIRGHQTWILPSKYSHLATQISASTWDGGAIWHM